MTKYQVTYSRTTEDDKEYKYRKAIVLAESKQQARFYVINAVNRYTECKKIFIVSCEEM